MQFWTGLFAFGTFAFLFFGDRILADGNRIGAWLLGSPPMPLPVEIPAERFWLTLTTSSMVTLTALCYYIQRDVVANKRLTIFVLISKIVSTLTYLGFYFLDAPFFNYLMGSVFCDGPIFVITLLVYRSALRSEVRE